MLKAYVSIDIEGLPGIASASMLVPGNTQYSRGSEIMTLFAVETARKLLENGFNQVVVGDSHGYMTNIDYSKMPRGTSLIQGFPRPVSMLTGLDESFNAALFIGYHSAASTVHGYLSHTMSGRTFAEIRINGIRSSEFLMNSLVAGEKGVPVILVAGDKYLESEVKAYSPWTVFVPLKEGITRYAAMYQSLPETLEMLGKGIYVAVNRYRRGEPRPLVLEKPYRVDVFVRYELIADVLETMKPYERVDALHLRFETDSAEEMVKIIELSAIIGYGVHALKQSIH